MKQDEILFFLGSIVVVVFAWIAFTVIHDSLTSTISETVSQAITPIAPTFDTKTITKIRALPTVIPQFSIQPPSQTAIIVTQSPVQNTGTSSAQTATTGGTLR